MRKICHCEFVIVVVIFSGAVASAAEHVQSMPLWQVPMINLPKANVPVAGRFSVLKIWELNSDDGTLEVAVEWNLGTNPYSFESHNFVDGTIE